MTAASLWSSPPKRSRLSLTVVIPLSDCCDAPDWCLPCTYKLCTARNAPQAPPFHLPPAHNLHVCVSPDFRWHTFQFSHSSNIKLCVIWDFWYLTQHRGVIQYRSFGTTYRSHLQGSGRKNRLTLEDGSIGCAETSVRNRSSTLHKVPEERRFLHHVMSKQRQSCNHLCFLSGKFVLLCSPVGFTTTWRIPRPNKTCISIKTHRRIHLY